MVQKVGSGCQNPSVIPWAGGQFFGRSEPLFLHLYDGSCPNALVLERMFVAGGRRKFLAPTSTEEAPGSIHCCPWMWALNSVLTVGGGQTWMFLGALGDARERKRQKVEGLWGHYGVDQEPLCHLRHCPCSCSQSWFSKHQ